MAKVLLFCFINCLFIYGSLASQCSVYQGVGTNDTTFRHLFALESLQNANKALMVDLHVSIDMGAEARIALTTEQNATNPSVSGDYILEIGTWDNDAIRLYKGKSILLELRLSSTLSTEIKSFWIHMTNEGLLLVGFEGESDAFITYQDPNPLEVKYFGFGSYGSNAYRFYYNCSSNKDLPIRQPTEELPQCSRYNVYDMNDNQTKYSLEDLNDYVNTSSYLVDFHFSVRATRGASVELLTEDGKGVYRIGLGTGYNQQCEVKKNGTQILLTDCFDILSGSEIRSFYIRISKDGGISIGRDEDSNDFAYVKDDDVLQVTDFRFSNLYRIPASYFYNCTKPGTL